MILTWSYPSLTTAGKNLTDIRRIVVWRASEELPVASAGSIDASNPQPVNVFAKIPPLTPAQFGKLRTRVDEIAASTLPKVTNGARLVYEDTPQLKTTDGRPIRQTYAVVTETTSSRSDYSNLTSIVPVEVPSAPADLTAEAKAKGIELSWQKPSDAKADLPGYNVYRHGEKESEDTLAAPINTAPVTTTTYTDTPAYGTFTYVVRAVAAAGTPRIESEPSAPVTATFKDLMPPPPPASMNALIETHAVRLVWDPVTAPDLAGYMLYREEATGHPDSPSLKSVGVIDLIHHLISTTTYVDPDALLGITYRYAVTAVDKNGNESARVWTPWVTVPKTP